MVIQKFACKHPYFSHKDYHAKLISEAMPLKLLLRIIVYTLIGYFIFKLHSLANQLIKFKLKRSSTIMNN